MSQPLYMPGPPGRTTRAELNRALKQIHDTVLTGDFVPITGTTVGNDVTGIIKSSSSLQIDTIDEFTADAGITIDGVLLKDNRVIIPDTGALVIGFNAQVAFGEVTSEAQILGTTETDGSLAIGLWSTTAALSPSIKFLKSANATIGLNTLVADSEVLGKIQAYGADGDTGLDTLVAEISFIVEDAFPVSGAIGGNILLKTATESGTLTTAITIGNSQRVTFSEDIIVSLIQSSTVDLTLNPGASLNITLTAADADAFTANDGTTDYVNIDTRIDTSGVHAHLFDTTNPSFPNIPTASFTLVNLVGYTSTVTTDANDITGDFATQLHVQRTTLNSDTASTNYTGIVSSMRLRGPSAGTNVILDNMAGIHIEDGGGGGGTETVQHGIFFNTLTVATTNYAITIGNTDVDHNLIHVGVGGDPIFSWDETDDRFTFSHGVDIDAGALNASNGGALTGTWSDLGSVSTIDINGGTVGGVTLDGTISGTPTWASDQAITLSTAAQPNITSLGSLTTLTTSGATLLGAATSYTPQAVTATSAGVAVALTSTIVHITTNGDSDLDNLTLADGVDGQVIFFSIVAVGNAADSVKITPASMIGGTIITFAADPLGLGCIMQYDAGADGWTVAGNNGGTVS